MEKKLASARRKLFCRIAGVVLLLPIPAMATTYTYTGANYTFNNDSATYGTNLTGSVTFNFDTTGFSGTVSGLGQITNLQLTSGTLAFNAGAAFQTEDYFDFVNGTITHWDVGLSEVSGTQPYLIGTCSPYGSQSTCFWPADNPPAPPNPAEYTDAAFLITGNQNDGFHHMLEADVTTETASWTQAANATPLPAALPLFASGLGGLGFLGWRRKRKIRDESLLAARLA